FVVLAHGSIFSKVGASSKLGAIHSALITQSLDDFGVLFLIELFLHLGTKFRMKSGYFADLSTCTVDGFSLDMVARRKSQFCLVNLSSDPTRFSLGQRRVCIDNQVVDGHRNVALHHLELGTLNGEPIALNEADCCACGAGYFGMLDWRSLR